MSKTDTPNQSDDFIASDAQPMQPHVLTADDILEMKTMIASLADQVRDADQQNAASVSEIRADVAMLMQLTQQARTDVPQKLAPALARAEEALAELSRLVGVFGQEEVRPAQDEDPAEAHSEAGSEADVDAETVAAIEMPYHLFTGEHGNSEMPAMIDDGEAPQAEAEDTHSVSFEPEAVNAFADQDGSEEDAVSEVEAGAKDHADQDGDDAQAAFDNAPAEDDVFDSGDHYDHVARIVHSISTVSAYEEQDQPPPALMSAVEPQDDHAEEVVAEDDQVFADEGETGAVDAGDAIAHLYGGSDANEASAVETATAHEMKMEPSERVWFEERFEALATQFAGLQAPEDLAVAIDTLSERLGGLEERIEAAVTAGPQDVNDDALRGIEASLIDLAGQVAQSQDAMERLGGIEREVGLISEKLNDEGIANIIAPIVSQAGATASVDTQALAKDVAGLISADLGRGDLNGETQLELAAIKQLVADMVAENKSGQTNTNSMLDTLQQAMVRLLDRVDAVEQAQLALVERAQSGSPDLREFAKSQRAGDVEMPSAEQVPVALAAGANTSVVDVDDAISAHRSAREKAAGFVSALSGRDMAVRENDDRDEIDHAEETNDQAREAATAEDAAARKRREFTEAARRAAANANERAARLRSELAGSAPVAPADEDADGELRADDGLAGDEAGQPKKKKRSLLRFWAAGMLLAAVALGSAQMVLSLHGGANAKEPVPVKVADGANKVPAASTPEADTGKVSIGVSVDKSGLTQPNGTVATASVVPTTLMPVAAKPEDAGTTAAGLPPAQLGPMSLRLAAAKGTAAAQFEIAVRYAEGRGVDQDFVKAAEWYQRAAGQGFAIAQYRLATLYERGMGVRADARMAKTWYERAAAQGNVKAMHNLAVIVAGDTVARRDYKAAVAWFKKAAASGLADSQYNLAILYQNGLGVAKDLTKAYRWYALAAKAGDKQAERQKTAIAGSVSKEARATIDREVVAWQPEPINRAINDPGYAGSLWQSGEAKA